MAIAVPSYVTSTRTHDNDDGESHTLPHMTSAEHAKLLWRRRLVAAKLLGVEHPDLVDRAVAEADSEEHLVELLSQPPLGLDPFGAEAVLTMQVRDRGPRTAARLREELDEIDEAISTSDLGRDA